MSSYNQTELLYVSSIIFVFCTQISKLAKIIINRDYDQNGTNSRYTEHITEEQGTMKTLLHLAADGFRPRLSLPSRKRNFIDIARCLIERDQQLVYVTTHPSEGRKQMPVELALENFDDEMASLLINKTAVKQRYFYAKTSKTLCSPMSFVVSQLLSIH